MLPKFITECNQLQLHGGADSEKCTGLCTHCMCCSTVPLWELSTNDGKGTTSI